MDKSGGRNNETRTLKYTYFYIYNKKKKKETDGPWRSYEFREKQLYAFFAA